MSLETEALRAFLADCGGEDVVALDLRETIGWTDYFVIATAGSEARLDGLERRVGEFCRERELSVRRPDRGRAALAARGAQNEWRVIDLGSIIVHLMTGRARSFYDLERLHSKAPR